MNNDDFTNELKQKREEYGVSQNKLAVACGNLSQSDREQKSGSL